MRFRRVVTIIFAIVCVAAVASSALAQKKKTASASGGSSQPVAEPLSKKRLLKLLTLNDSTQPELIQIVGQKGVDFKPTPSDERELHDAGGSDELIVAVRANYRDGTSSSTPTPESSGAIVSNADAPLDSQPGPTPSPQAAAPPDQPAPGSQAATPPAQPAPNTATAPPPAAKKKKGFLDKLNDTMNRANAVRASQAAGAQTPAATQTAPPAEAPTAPAEPTDTAPPPTETTGTAQAAPPGTNATAPAQREPDSVTSSGKVIHHTGRAPAAQAAPPGTYATAPAQREPDSVTSSGKVIHHTGRAPAATAPAPPPDTTNIPSIMASPNNIALVAGKGQGKTTLTWDAGGNHPNAEVWVKVDDQNETKVVEQGKGTLPVVVVPGKTYVYTLKDKGKVLATVTVQFHR